MPFGGVQDYQGRYNAETLVDGDRVFVKVYNASTALSNGTVGTLSFTARATAPFLVGTFVAGFATQATSNVVVAVVNNEPRGQSTIPQYEYGWVQIAGYCPYTVTSGTVNVNDQLQGINSGTSLIDQGTNGGVVIDEETCAGRDHEGFRSGVAHDYLPGTSCRPAGAGPAG